MRYPYTDGTRTVLLKNLSQRLKVKYVFAGFEMGRIDPHDAVPIRVLKTLLRASIPEIRPSVNEAIEAALGTNLSHSKPSFDGIFHSIFP